MRSAPKDPLLALNELLRIVWGWLRLSRKLAGWIRVKEEEVFRLCFGNNYVTLFYGVKFVIILYWCNGGSIGAELELDIMLLFICVWEREFFANDKFDKPAGLGGRVAPTFVTGCLGGPA